MVEKFLPNCSRGNVLITSRNPNLRTLVEPLAYCEIEEMEVEDAIELLLKAAYLNVSLQSLRQKARKIVSELCCLALAIDQAGTAIGSGICQLDDYLARYAQSRDALLNDTTFKGASRYNRCVYTTWDISYEDIVRNSLDESDQRRQKSNSHAILVIRLFAFFHNVQIPEELFSRAAVQIGQHRAAVHDDQLSKQQGDWEKAEVILRQILLDRDDTRIDTISSLYVEEHLAELLYRQHRTEGRQLMEAVLIRTQREYGAEHPFTLRVMQKLAVLLKDSDPQKAVSLASTASDKLESGNGSDHPYTLRSKGTTFESQLRDSRPEAEIVAPAEGSEEATIASSNVADEAAERIDQTFEDNYDGIDWLRLPRLTKPLTTSRRKPSWIYQHGYCVVLR
ncbi:unnamed protein product [Alternaria alternata]